MDAPQGGSDRDKSNPSSSPVSVVSNFWKEFDLEKEKSVHDEQGLRVAENQENSQKNRRRLAESTGDFKKASAEEKLSLFNSLLKGYQEEVNNLTNRAKFGENAFLNIYQKLYEAPDPYPALASIAEQDLKISELESENQKMKVDLDKFRTEATHLKNQQATIRRLEERNCQLEQQKKMPRQASSATNDSQPTRRTLRKWAYDDDVILVSCMVDLHNIENYNADTGFKTGYLLELEKMMARKLPNSNIKGKPHIESRIKTLKKDWSTIFDMVQGCGNIGFRWDSMKNMVTAEEPVWESYLISHKDVTQFRVRSFAFYKQLCQIYAKDRALRRDAQTAANILEEIVEEGNAQTATNIHDAEDGNQSHLGLEDMDISSTQCLASTSASTKKRKAHGMGESIFEESFIKAATLLGNKMEIVGRELSKSIGSEMIIQQRVQELYGALCEIDDLTEDELDNVLSKIPNQPNQLLVFFSLPSTRRLGWVKRFLANNS